MIVFYKGFSQYDAMRIYIDEIEAAFIRLGYDTCVIDAASSSYLLKQKQISENDDIDFIFVCNGILFNNPNFRKQFPNTYFVTYMCDHPASHYDRLNALDEKCIVFSCDGRHDKYIEKYYPNIKHNKFVPLGGSYCKKYVPYREKTIDVIFTGSYEEPQIQYLQNINMFDGVLKQFCEYMMGVIIKEPSYDIEECLKIALNHFGVTVSNQEFAELAKSFIVVDSYARKYFRDKIIRHLVENGIVIHVYGNGWENFEGVGKENIIIEPGNYYNAQKDVGNAKISINIMPWFKDGFQERIVTAMYSETISVTDDSEYIRANFENNKDLIMFSLNEIDTLSEKIKYLLENPVEAEKIAKNGRNRALEGIDWYHRVIEMEKYIAQCIPSLKPIRKNEGKICPFPFKTNHDREIAVDTLQEIDKILKICKDIQQYQELTKEDIHFLYSKYLRIMVEMQDNYPEVSVSDVIGNFIIEMEDEDIQAANELFLRECFYVKGLIEHAEKQLFINKCEMLQKQIEVERNTPNVYTQKVLLQRLNKRYSDSKDPEIINVLENINGKGFVEVYNYSFVEQTFRECEKQLAEKIFFDESVGMYYVLWNEKKMYYPSIYSKDQVFAQVRFAMIEQNENSPHRYIIPAYEVEKGDIVVDAGVAEGNFALDIVDIASKVYLVECNAIWIEPLRKTFEPWKDKVVIIQKMLGDTNDEQYTSIDGFVQEGYVNYIKMDVEGAEEASLRGAKNILENSKSIKCALCAYHKSDAKVKISNILEQYGFDIETSKGYMFFRDDINSWSEGELRKGLVRGKK